MRAIADLFDSTTLVLPCAAASVKHVGETPLAGQRLTVVPLTEPQGQGIWRKAGLLWWLLRNAPELIREIRRADAVHAPIPGDIGTIGMFLAVLLRKPLFVRHCGNWFVQTTAAERFWKWFMQRAAGGRNVMLATGGGPEAPSARNPALRWIFSTASTEVELQACARGAGTRPVGTRLIIACRQDPEKGAGIAIRSLPFLTTGFPGVTLDVVGDGPALGEFKQLAQSLGVADRVTFHGKVAHDQVIHLLQQADVFCYPTSASEGFPKIVLEALACGLPVITTRVSVLPELIGTGCGILIDEAAPQEVAAAVTRCFADSVAYDAMSRCAVETAAQYSLERWKDAIGQLLAGAWGPLRSDRPREPISNRPSVARA